MTPDTLSGGFADPARDAARAFRLALTALARPGTIVAVEGARPPAPLSVAAGVLLLTLADGTTPVYLAPPLDRPETRDWLTFHCGLRFVPPEQASFAVGRWADLQPITRFATGTPDYPDRSATLIVEHALDGTPNARLTGPGLAAEAQVCLPEVAAFAANRRGYPLGFDTYLTDGARLMGLPRSTTIEAL